MTDPLDHIKHLAAVIGARTSGGDGERRAGEYVREQLTAYGLVTKDEPFLSVRSFGHVLGLVYIIALLGLLAAATGKPTLGFLAAGVALVAFVGETTTALRLASAALPRGKSSNVVGRLVPRDLPRKRLVILAHRDTLRSGLIFRPGLIKRFRVGYLATAISILALAIVSGGEAVAHDSALWWAGVPFAALLIVALLLLVERELLGKPVAGANSNASGVGVMLALAEGLARDVPSDTEVLFVATGAAEAGTVGIEHFLRRHSEEVERAWIINITSVGAGTVNFLTSEGTLMHHAAGREISEMAAAVAKLPGLAVRRAQFHVMGTDATPALLRGLDAVTVMGLCDGLPVNYGSPSDDMWCIDPDSVDTAYRFVEAMVRRLIA